MDNLYCTATTKMNSEEIETETDRVCAEFDAEADSAVPLDIEQAANRATLDLLPQKSKQQYDIAYSRFMQWCKSKKVEGKFSETVFLAFFEEKSKVWKSSTMWSNYSMIKASLLIKNNVDISKYHKLLAFLKRQNVGYRPKKSKILTREQIDKFLNEAPDTDYLMMKVAIIFGVFGACRREELCSLKLDEIEELENSLLIHIPDTKTNVQRSFCIPSNYVSYYRKYAALRSPSTPHRRFFVKYVNNKCTIQPVGINTFGKMPADIATYLKLSDPKFFTGHCFRRSSASLLANSGADLTMIKRHGGWRSSTVAEGYIEDSIGNKNKIAGSILPVSKMCDEFPVASAAATSSNSDKQHSELEPSSSSNNTGRNVLRNSLSSQGLCVSNCSNCNVNITIYK